MATVKKTKKIETPIDERETFVSLQKSFSESDVEEKLKTLYALQTTDNAIEKIVQLRGELPGEVTALEEELAGLQSKVAHAESMIAEYNQAIEENKRMIDEYDADIKKFQAQQDSIANSREYGSIEKDIENQNLLMQISQKNIGKAVASIDDRKAEIESLQERIAVVEEDLAAKREELSTIVESTAAEEEQLQARRAECAAKIDARTLSAYERIRSSVHNHLAVVSIYNGDSCGGCFNTITPQRIIEVASNKKMVICEHCGRIIVNPDFV